MAAVAPPRSLCLAIKGRQTQATWLILGIPRWLAGVRAARPPATSVITTPVLSPGRGRARICPPSCGLWVPPAAFGGGGWCEASHRPFSGFSGVLSPAIGALDRPPGRGRHPGQR